MTKEILQAINRKRRLWKEAKKGRNREQYEEADTRVQKLIRNAKRNYEKTGSSVVYTGRGRFLFSSSALQPSHHEVPSTL
jgi:Zn-dependent oligopeptidase